MGRILNFTSLFSKVETTTTTSSTTTAKSSSSASSSCSSWAWPSCNHPKTASFRRDVADVFKTTNSIFFNDSTDSSFANSSEDHSLLTFSEDDSETIIRGLTRSDRLFFEPGGDTSSILDEAHKTATIPFKESCSLVMAMESEDPYGDFRKSMEEMVVANGAKDWEFLEELLVWYLRVNGKKNHGFIVGAFVDLLVGLASSSSPSPSPCEIFEDEIIKDVSVITSCCDSMSSISCEVEEVEEEGSGSC